MLGLLLVGDAAMVGVADGRFAVISKPQRIYPRVGGAGRGDFDCPQAGDGSRLSARPARRPRLRARSGLPSFVGEWCWKPTVGGTLTGRGGDIIVIDDPVKPDDAPSEIRRTAANQWFTNTLLSRLDDKRTGAIVIVMQRVHMDDLTGFVVSTADEWEVLNLPAIAEADEDIPISATKVHCRKAGDALSPAREPIAVLENLKLQLGSDAFSAPTSVSESLSPIRTLALAVSQLWRIRNRSPCGGKSV